MARIRAYFKLDLYFFEHPKVVDLSHSAMVLYIASIAYCNRRETDGFVARPVLRRLIELDWQDEAAPTHEEVAAELVKAGLWVEVPRPGSVRPDTDPRPPDGPGGWQIHDFLDHNDSNEDRAKRRAADAARKREERGGRGGESAGQGRAGASPGNVQPDRYGRPNGQVPASERVPPIAVTEQSSNRAEGKINTVVEQARPDDDPIAVVFDAWRQSTGKHRAKLDPKRHKRIKAALRSYALADVLDAVRGWQHSPHHRGENDTGTVYNELDLLLRDAAHIEQFRDLWRHGPPAQISRQAQAAMRTSVAMRARTAEGRADHDLRGVGGPGGPPQRGLPAPAD